jgi:4-hydroxybenzoate polyprenyltransferase
MRKNQNSFTQANHRKGTVPLLLRTMRPIQWMKNLFIFAALIFSQKLGSLRMDARAGLAFLIFCLLAGALYVFNDLQDLKEDKVHPLKRKRPLASGRLSPGLAWAAFFLLSLISLAAAFFLDRDFFYTAGAYFLLQIGYSLILKHVVILDVFAIALGFTLRVIAGAAVVSVPVSSWLLICTILLSLFLAAAKRRYELRFLKNARAHRPVLFHYSLPFLDQMIAIITASLVIAYCLYTFSSETIAHFGSRNLIFSSPFVLYGVFRYLYLIHQKGGGGTPEELIVRDKSLLAAIVLWTASVVVLIYVV